jgi:oligoribonuclease (3'-5' exoribonuclease)
MSVHDSRKPRGYVKYILAVDCETTGLCYGSSPVTDGVEHYQTVSWGVIVLNADDLSEVERDYFEIKWNGSSNWAKRAEEVHGLSKKHLAEHGMTEEEAAIRMATLILKYWGPNQPVMVAGHNVATFDLLFLKDLLHKHELFVKFGNRYLDSFSASFATVGTYNSDDMFELFGCKERKAHNAMEDIEFTVKCLRMIRKLWDSEVGLTYGD